MIPVAVVITRITYTAPNPVMVEDDHAEESYVSVAIQHSTAWNGDFPDRPTNGEWSSAAVLSTNGFIVAQPHGQGRAEYEQWVLSPDEMDKFLFDGASTASLEQILKHLGI